MYGNPKGKPTNKMATKSYKPGTGSAGKGTMGKGATGAGGKGTMGSGGKIAKGKGAMGC